MHARTSPLFVLGVVMHLKAVLSIKTIASSSADPPVVAQAPQTTIHRSQCANLLQTLSSADDSITSMQPSYVEITVPSLYKPISYIRSPELASLTDSRNLAIRSTERQLN